MPIVDVTVFNASADEPGGTDLTIQAPTAAASAQASAPSASQQSNSISVPLDGTSVTGIAQPTLQGGSGGLFPKLANAHIGERTYAEDNAEGEAERAYMALYDIAMIGLFPDGPWDVGQSGWLGRKEIIQDLLSKNPNLTIFDYTNVMESGQSGTFSAKLFSEQGPGGTDWWVWKNASFYPSDPVNNIVTSFSSGLGVSYWTNHTDETTPDADGNRYPQIYGNHRLQKMFDPVLDAGDVPTGLGGYNVMMDNAFMRSRRSQTDINGNTVNDDARGNYLADQNPPHDPEGVAAWSAWRQGETNYIAHMKSAHPGMLALANSAEWSVEQDTYASLKRPFPPEWVDVWDAAWVERMSAEGFPYSRVLPDGSIQPQNFGSWEMAYWAYVYTMENVSSVGMGIMDWHLQFEQAGFEPVDDRKSPEFGYRVWPREPDSGPFHAMRWGLATTLLHDGYVCITGNASPPHGEYGGCPQFDEFGTINQGTTGLSKGWLGEATQPPQLSPWTGDLWSRTFENGMVIVNTSLTLQSSIQVVDILPSAGEIFDGFYKRILGVQDPSTNNGSTLYVVAPGLPRTINIPPIDALILQVA